MKPLEFITLSSSRGTTFQAVLDRIADGSLPGTCRGLVTDDIANGCRDKAIAAGLPVCIVSKPKGEKREEYDRRLDAAIRHLHEDAREPLIACMGWMRILSPSFVARWRNRILNVHPSLLPKHPGAHGIEDALASGDAETGMTIHLIDEGVDTGPILRQASCPIRPDDTVETLKTRVQALEAIHYPDVLRAIAEGRITLPPEKKA